MFLSYVGIDSFVLVVCLDPLLFLFLLVVILL